MNDYLNHKWRSFLKESNNPRPRLKRLYEARENQDSVVQAEAGRKSIPYPQFRITDEFGEIGTKGREDAEMFFSKVAGEGTDMREKIDAIKKFMNPKITEEEIEKMPIEQVLGTLVTLDVFSAIVHKFDPSGSGFLFEGFMAALFGAQGKQIKTDDPEGGIEDIWDFAGERVSLKLLAGGKLDGSISDLRDTIKNNVNSDGQPNQPIRYIYAKKKSGKGTKEVHAIEFYEFTLGTDGREWQWQSKEDKAKNEYNWLKKTRPVKGDFTADLYMGHREVPKGFETEKGTTASDYQRAQTYYKKGKGYVGQTELSQKGKELIKKPIEGDSKTKNINPKDPSTWLVRNIPKAQQTKVKVTRSWAGSSPPRFEIPSAMVAKTEKVGSKYHIGTIEFGDEAFIKGLAEKFAARLQNGISEIYDSLALLTDSINHYLMEGKNAKSGDNAIAAAKSLVDNTNCVVDDVCKQKPKK